MNTAINVLPWYHPENGGKLEAINVEVFKEEATKGKVCVAFELQWQGEKVEGLWICWIPDDLEKVSLGLAAWIEPVLVTPSETYFPMLTDPLWINQWVANGTLKRIAIIEN